MTGISGSAIRALATAAALALTLTGTASAAQAGPARAQTGPDAGFGITPRPAAAISSVSCLGQFFCMGVGSYSDPSGTVRSLAEQWNGQVWRLTATSAGGLNSVSCVSAHFCLAVGGGAESWDGAHWHAIPGSPSGGVVSCSSASFCMVARTDGAAVWNGQKWRRVRLSIDCPSAPQYPCSELLPGLSCTSKTFCLAVGTVDPGYPGDDTVPLDVAERWDGAKWTQISVPSPDPDGGGSTLSGLSCTSSAFCLAVGGSDIVLTWFGRAWTVLNGGLFSQQNSPAVSCVARENCYLLNGSAQAQPWIHALSSPPPPAGGQSGATALSCTGVSATQCTATGSYTVPVGGQAMTLAERWTGSAWLLQRTPTPADLFDGLSGVSCLGASFCVAVGGFHTAADTEQALAQEWNGRGWKLLAPVSPGTQVNFLASVSCPTRSLCLAVGSSDDGTGSWRTLAQEWNGTAWTVLPTPNPGPNDQLDSISCPSATSCMAVGSSHSGARAFTGTLAEQWNGSTWTVLPTPDSGSAAQTPQFNILAAVSCVRPTWCMAVGDADLKPPAYAGALAAVWNGTSWSQVPAPDPGGNMELDAVSCTSSTRCVAAGQYVHGGNPISVPQAGQTIKPAADVWNGATWTLRPPPRLAPGETGLLNGVSCPTAAGCLAVGEFITPAGDVRELAEAWDNHAWRSIKITSLSAQFSDLFAIDCTSATRCLATGEVTTQRTLAARWNGTAWLSQNAINP